MHIQRLDPTDRRHVRRYIELPFRLYADNPLWVPPFVGEVAAQLNPRRHPFYEHSQAAFFLAMEGGEAVGRIAVLDHARYNEYHGQRTAFFYHFEAVNDRAVSRALFAAAADWARGRGLDRLWGPKGFMAGDGQGILVEGFEHRPAMGIPYHFPYIAELVEDAGLVKQLDFISCYLDRQIGLPERFLEVAARVKQRRGLRTVTFRTKAELRAMAPRVMAVYNDSFKEVQGYVPVTEAEAKVITERFISVADPTLLKLLMHEDEIVGFVLIYPDLSAAIQRCKGRMWPTGWWHLLREFKRTEWLDFNGIGIEERYRGIGGNALLYAEMYDTLIGRLQYQYGDLAQVQETNMRMVQELGSLGVRPYKRHRLYEMSLA